MAQLSCGVFGEFTKLLLITGGSAEFEVVDFANKGSKLIVGTTTISDAAYNNYIGNLHTQAYQRCHQQFRSESR